jgi:hypothetical protein
MKIPENNDEKFSLGRSGLWAISLSILYCGITSNQIIGEKNSRLDELATELKIDIPKDLRIIEETPESITVATANGTQTISRVELEQAQAELIKEHPEYEAFLKHGKVQIFDGTKMTDSAN